MKNLLLSFFLMIIGAGISFAGCKYDESVPVLAKSDHQIIIISDNHQLIKYEDQDGITRFDLKNSDGEIEAEYMSMIVLSIDYPEIHELVKSQEVSSSQQIKSYPKIKCLCSNYRFVLSETLEIY